jgi:hypothetical protein
VYGEGSFRYRLCRLCATGKHIHNTKYVTGPVFDRFLGVVVSYAAIKISAWKSEVNPHFSDGYGVGSAATAHQVGKLEPHPR